LNATVLTSTLNGEPSIPDGLSVIEIPKTRHPLDLPGRIRRQSHSRFALRINARKAFAQHLETETPDVVIAHYGHIGLRYTSMCERRSVPFLVHFHGADLSRHLRSQRYRRALSRMLREGVRCVVVSQDQKERLLGLGGDSEQIRIIPCGAPLEEFRFVQRCDQAACRFLFVGRLVEKKSPLTLLRGFAMHLRNHPDSRLTIVGDGVLLERARELSGSLGIAGTVVFTGALLNSEVRKHMESSSVLVQPSVTASDGDMEGAPTVIFEGSATGMPVVATRHAGIPEQVVHGTTGYLVEENDLRGMARYMDILAENRELRRRFGQRARMHVEKVGNLDKQLDKMRSFLRDVTRI
jgi:glycosyltransferase involved in cell wall biosynthesis